MITHLDAVFSGLALNHLFNRTKRNIMHYGSLYITRWHDVQHMNQWPKTPHSTATTRRLLENVWGTLTSTDRCRRVRVAWPLGLRGSFVVPSALALRPQSAQTASRETWQFSTQIQLKICTTKMRTQKSACAITDIYLSITRLYQILNVFFT